MNRSNLQNDANNDFQSNVLGSVEPVQANPVEPENLGSIDLNTQPLEDLNINESVLQNPKVDSLNNTEILQGTEILDNTNVNTDPTAVPIPGTEEVDNKNNFTDPNKDISIGSVPPPMNNNKKGKTANKILLILLVLVLMAGVAYGVYFFLNKANGVTNKLSVTTKEVKLNIGDKIPEKVTDYVTVNNGNAESCTVTTDAKSEVAGTYEYKVICNEETFKGKIIVEDTEAPKLTVNVVFKDKNSSYDITDFYSECIDSSECNVSFVNEEEIAGFMQTEGLHTVKLKASDANSNTQEFETSLYVTNTPIFSFYTCKGLEEAKDGFKKQIHDTFPLSHTDDGNTALAGVNRRDYVFTFDNEEEYNKVVNDKPSTLTIDNVTGVALYFDSTYQVVISTDLPVSTLNSENNGSFPTTFGEFYNLYVTQKNNICSNESEYKFSNLLGSTRNEGVES